MDSTFDVCVLGSANSDLFLKVTNFPKEGETIDAQHSYTKNGGKGANQAVASSLSGSKTVFAGQMGHDSMAQKLITEMTLGGVDLSGLVRSETSQTGQAIILLNDKGENCIVIIGAANMDFDTTQLPQKFLDVLNQSRLLQMQMEVPYMINVLAAEEMSKQHKFMMLDCGGRADPIDARILKHLTFLSPNETELERVLGHAVTQTDEFTINIYINSESLIKVVREELLSHYVNLHVLLKMGVEGSLLITKDFSLRKLAATAYNTQILQDYTIIDTVGAGDCFTSAFCSQFYSQCRSHNINNTQDLNACQAAQKQQIFSQAMEFASCSAFLCITKEGAMPSMPTRQQVDQFMKKYNLPGL